MARQVCETGELKLYSRKTKFRLVKKQKELYFLLIPGILYYIIFRYVPLLGTVIAFQDYSIFRSILDSPWVGLEHFRRLFSYAEFLKVFTNTLVLAFYDIIFSFPMPIILSLMLNEILKRRFKSILQTIVYFPHFLSWVVVGGLFIQILSPSTGIINTIIPFFGLEPIHFMASESWIRPILIFSDVWRNTGWGTIVYLAAISGINPSLYEAAIIDGANRKQQTWHITIPGILQVAVVLLLLRTGHFLDLGFERVYIFQNAANIQKSDIIATYIYRVGLQGQQFSYTTAIGVFKSIIGFLLLVINNYVSKKLTGKGLY